MADPATIPTIPTVADLFPRLPLLLGDRMAAQIVGCRLDGHALVLVVTPQGDLGLRYDLATVHHALAPAVGFHFQQIRLERA